MVYRFPEIVNVITYYVKIFLIVITRVYVSCPTIMKLWSQSSCDNKDWVLKNNCYIMRLMRSIFICCTKSQSNTAYSYLKQKLFIYQELICSPSYFLVSFFRGGGPIAQLLAFCLMFCRPRFVFLIFLLWHLRLLIVRLVSSKQDLDFLRHMLRSFLCLVS
jgi:hypothetical protein